MPIPASLLSRIAKLEAARRTYAPPPINDRRFIAKITLMLLLGRGLDDVAHQFDCRDETELWHLCLNDRPEFCRRYAKLHPSSYCHQANTPEAAKAYREATDAGRFPRPSWRPHFRGEQCQPSPLSPS